MIDFNGITLVALALLLAVLVYVIFGEDDTNGFR